MEYSGSELLYLSSRVEDEDRSFPPLYKWRAGAVHLSHLPFSFSFSALHMKIALSLIHQILSEYTAKIAE